VSSLRKTGRGEVAEYIKKDLMMGERRGKKNGTKNEEETGTAKMWPEMSAEKERPKWGNLRRGKAVTPGEKGGVKVTPAKN